MTLHMIHAPLDMRALNRWAAERGLMRDVPDPRTGRKRAVVDADFTLHALLRGCFGDAAPQPFRLFAGEGPQGTLYGYAAQDAAALAALAQMVAAPDLLGVFDPAAMRSKIMPEALPAGTRLGFDLRARPIRRLRHALFDPQQGKDLAAGAEIDAYRLALLRAAPDGPNAATEAMTRDRAYIDWLQERMSGAAILSNVALAAMRRTPTRRGDARGPEGPDATFHGDLTVTDPAAFAALLRGGVGRHKSYGFGMLILRPPGTAPKER